MEKDLQEMTDKFNTAREDNITLKEDAIENKTKLDAYDAVVADKDVAVADKAEAESKFADSIKVLGEKVALLAVPFDANYKAPEDMEQLLKDLDTYM